MTFMRLTLIYAPNASVILMSLNVWSFALSIVFLMIPNHVETESDLLSKYKRITGQ